MSLPASPQGPPDQHIDAPEHNLVHNLLKACDEDLPEGDAIEEEVERLQGDIKMLQRLAGSSSEATRKKCEEVAVKLRTRAVTILDKALREDIIPSGEHQANPEEYFIGALDYGPNDSAGRKVYVGAILQEARLGLGSMRWVDGTCYQGEWLHDKSNGFAVETYADGSVYRGQFHEDQRSGIGSWTDPGGTAFIGAWKEGEKHGTGVVMKRVDGVAKCALCAFEAGVLQGKELVQETDERYLDVMQSAGDIIKDAEQMAEAAKKLEEEVVLRGPQTPRKQVLDTDGEVPGSTGELTIPAHDRDDSPSKIPVYRPEEIVVRRDRLRLRMRGAKRGGLTRGSSQLALRVPKVSSEQARSPQTPKKREMVGKEGDNAEQSGEERDQTEEGAVEASVPGGGEGEPEQRQEQGNAEVTTDEESVPDDAEQTAADNENVEPSAQNDEQTAEPAPNASSIRKDATDSAPGDDETPAGPGFSAAAADATASSTDAQSEGEASTAAAVVLQATIRACPRSVVVIGGAAGAEEQGKYGLMWPRRFGPESRILRAAGQRLQGVVRRAVCDVGVKGRASETLLAVCGRCVSERKYRMLLHRPTMREDAPATMRRRLFLRTEDMDRLDAETTSEWMTLYWRLETNNHELRRCQGLLASLAEDSAETTKYEARLHHDIERGGGGGLVRQLGGPKAAKKKLSEVQSHLQELSELTSKETETQRRVEKEIRWLYKGHLESLLATEELVEEGHIRCAKGECVTIASRYRADSRLHGVSKDVGRLGDRHSEGTWWVRFDLLDVTQGLAAGGEGIYHLKYSTELERKRLLLKIQEDEMEERRVEEERRRVREEMELSSRGPRSLSFNRNPVRCWYNVPLSQFVENTDLRYAAFALNHAAQDGDPRRRPMSKVQVNSVTAQCSGKEPFTYSWRPKWPALELPLGLELDAQSGEVTGTPQFEGKVTCYVKCADADGFTTTTELRFECSRPDEHTAAAEPPMTVQEIEDGDSFGSSGAPPVTS